MINAILVFLAFAVVVVLIYVISSASNRSPVAVVVRTKTRIAGPCGNQNPDVLLKRATSKKKAGDMEGAIQILQQAYRIISTDVTQYPVATFLRLPLYLQHMGKNDEAWREFNRLLTEGYPNQPSDKQSIASDMVQIYDKMRLFLQREGRALQAVKYGAYSLFLQGQAGYRATREEVDDSVAKMMRKVKRTELSGDVARIVWQAIQTPKKIPMKELGHRLNAYLSDRSG